MKFVYSLDNIKMELQPADIDGDGVVGGIETIPQRIDSGVTSIIQETDLSGSLKELNKDTDEVNSRQSAIDLRTRLYSFFQINAISAYEYLVEVGMIPKECICLTKQIKRNLVSHKGEGRKEMVNLVAGKREMDSKNMGFMDKMKQGMFGQQQN